MDNNFENKQELSHYFLKIRESAVKSEFVK